MEVSAFHIACLAHVYLLSRICVCAHWCVPVTHRGMVGPVHSDSVLGPLDVRCGLGPPGHAGQIVRSPSHQQELRGSIDHRVLGRDWQRTSTVREILLYTHASVNPYLSPFLADSSAGCMQHAHKYNGAIHKSGFQIKKGIPFLLFSSTSSFRNLVFIFSRIITAQRVVYSKPLTSVTHWEKSLYTLKSSTATVQGFLLAASLLISSLSNSLHCLSFSMTFCFFSIFQLYFIRQSDLIITAEWLPWQCDTVYGSHCPSMCIRGKPEAGRAHLPALSRAYIKSLKQEECQQLHPPTPLRSRGSINNNRNHIDKSEQHELWRRRVAKECAEKAASRQSEAIWMRRRVEGRNLVSWRD